MKNPCRVRWYEQLSIHAPPRCTSVVLFVSTYLHSVALSQ